MTLKATPDSGAARTVLLLAAVPLGVVLAPSRTRLRAANDTGFKTAGTVYFTASIGQGPKVAMTATVTPDMSGLPLVGWRDLKKLGVLGHNFPELCVDTVAVGDDVLWLGEDGDDAYAEDSVVRL
jgi:hypothetical protein